MTHSNIPAYLCPPDVVLGGILKTCTKRIWHNVCSIASSPGGICMLFEVSMCVCSSHFQRGTEHGTQMP